MNTLTVIVLLILAVFALNGYSRGFVKTVTGMFFFVLTAVLVYYTTPYVSDFLKNQTPVYRIVERSCQGLLEDMMSAGPDDGKEEAESAEYGVDIWQEVPRAEQSGIIDSLPLPESLKTQLKDKNNSFTYENLAAETFGQYLAGYLASLVFHIIIYVVTFLLVSLVLRLTVMTLDVIVSLPVLHGVNQIFGLVLGLVQGIAVIWLAFLVLTVFLHTDFGAKIMEMVNESAVLRALYNSNLFLKSLFRMG